MEKKILEIINTVLENRGKKQITSFQSDLDLRSDIGFDSLDLAELTVRIEAEYNIDIFEDSVISKAGQILEKLKA